ncbi:NAD dehydrogenase [Dichotomocladium elegans]|nr:NAD dehydrogenase [Dichotomocladium elegans]
MNSRAISSLRAFAPKKLRRQQRRFSVMNSPDVEVDNLIIGAGVVGLAIGEKITRERPAETTIVIDKNKRCGEETSSRNSEVIHAGIYYPHDSLKTRLCIEGKKLLYDLLKRADLPYQKVGKLVIAQNEDQKEYLEHLRDKSVELGVETEMMTANKVMEMEPHVRAQAGLFSPTTGILDSHAYMDYLEHTITQNGGDVGLNMCATAIVPTDRGYIVSLVSSSRAGNSETTSVLARRVFNSAGLHADKVSNMVLPKQYTLHYARGCYFAYNGSLRVNHLIYPCPDKNLAGLGTHLTLDMTGKIKFGPDVTYIRNPYDYSLPDDEEYKQQFVSAIQRFMPSIEYSKLHPDYAGIRPKLAGPGASFRDFEIKEERDSGLANFFTLLGIESPGLTSSLSIAEHVHSMIRY